MSVHTSSSKDIWWFASFWQMPWTCRCIFDIVEHAPTSPLIAMVVEKIVHSSWPWVQKRRTSPSCCTERSRAASNSITKASLSFCSPPQIYPSRSADVKETECLHQQKNVAIYRHQTDCIENIRVTNLDAPPSHIHRKPEADLSRERDKKKQYLQACLDQRRHCSPFIVSCDWVLRNEAKAELPNLAGSLTKKIRRALFRICKLHEV